jgi:hypothetical protein
MKFVLNCIKLIDVIMSLLQITALGVHGVNGVLALLPARLPLMFLHATENATWWKHLAPLTTPALMEELVQVLLWI